MSSGLFVLRVVLGLLLAGHGTQKLFGWWGGHGPEATGKFMDSLGHRPGRRMAMTAGIAETGGGLLVALGLFSPIGNAVIVAVMLVAATAHAENGLWNDERGFELPIFYATTAAALALTGPGSASLDAAIGWHSDAILGVVGVLLGAAAALVRISGARAVLDRESAAAPAPADHDAERSTPTRRAA